MFIVFNALLRMTLLQESFLSRFRFNVYVMKITYSPSRPSKLIEKLEITRLL